MKYFLPMLICFGLSFTIDAQDQVFRDLNWKREVSKKKKAKSVQTVFEKNGDYLVASETKDNYTLISIFNDEGRLMSDTVYKRGASCRINHITTWNDQYIVVGYVYKGLISAIEKTGWIMCLDDNGRMIWEKVLPKEQSEEFHYVEVKNGNELFIIGNREPNSNKRTTLVMRTDMKGDTIEEREILQDESFLISNVTKIDENRYFLGGSKKRRGKETAFFVVMRNGQPSWRKEYSEEARIKDAVVTYDKKLVFIGDRYRNRLDRDVWASKIDYNRQLIEWDKAFGNDFGDEFGSHITELPDGKTLLLATSYSHIPGTTTPKIWYHPVNYEGNANDEPRHLKWKSDHTPSYLSINSKGNILIGGNAKNKAFFAEYKFLVDEKPFFKWVSPELKENEIFEISKKGSKNYLEYIAEIVSPVLLQKDQLRQKVNGTTRKSRRYTENLKFEYDALREGKFVYKIRNKMPISSRDTTLKLQLFGQEKITSSEVKFKLSQPHILIVGWASPVEANYDIPPKTVYKNNYPVKLVVQSTRRLKDENFILLVNDEPVDGAKYSENILRPVRRQTQELVPDSYTYDNSIFLKKGKNEIKLKVLVNGIEAYSNELNINYAGTEEYKQLIQVDTTYDPTVTNLHVLAIGVDHVDLQHTTQDAKDIKDAFEQLETKGIFKNVEVEAILGQDANNVAISSKLENYKELYRLGEIKPEDLFVLFISSHGFIYKDSIPSQNSWIPYESFMIQGSNFDDAAKKATSVSYQDIIIGLAQIQCKKLVLIDACFSGGVKNENPSGNELLSINEKILEAGRRQPGLVTITSSTDQQPSYENNAWENGAFTEAIIEAFEQGDYNNDEIISISELYKYIYQRIPQLVKEATGQEQNPTITTHKLGTVPIYKR